MRKIAILDTWINDTNLGNIIIMQSVVKVLRDIFPHDIIYHLPASEYLSKGRNLIKQADYVFLGGTNVLSSNMNKTSDWCLRLRDLKWINNVVLLGVGWWQYQEKTPNIYSRTLLKKALSRSLSHSVRDSYTEHKLRSVGINSLNTGCPTIWGLTKEKCDEIPLSKGRSVLLTFTEYNQNPKYDSILFEILKRKYETVYFWPQQFGDYSYAKTICGNEFIFVDPSIEALDHILQKESIDYCGTRLHAGIRALQFNCRSIIISVDNRATEMGRDFSLPTLKRELILDQLENLIDSDWETKVNLDQNAILTWKKQFDY